MPWPTVMAKHPLSAFQKTPGRIVKWLKGCRSPGSIGALRAGSFHGSRLKSATKLFDFDVQIGDTTRSYLGWRVRISLLRVRWSATSLSFRLNSEIWKAYWVLILNFSIRIPWGCPMTSCVGKVAYSLGIGECDRGIGADQQADLLCFFVKTFMPSPYRLRAPRFT